MQQLRVATAALLAMTVSWGTSAGALTETAAPAKLALSSPPSAAAVNAAHANVAIFTADPANRVDMRAHHVADTDTRYIAHESHSVEELKALTDSLTVG
jgi:hypothetical protein